MGIVRFRLTRVNTALLHGIVEAEGYKGYWLFRERVRYRVGDNCDAIAITGARLVVMQDAKPIAIAKYRPGATHDQAPGAVRWEELLQPGKSRGSR